MLEPSKFNENLHRRIEIKDGKPKLGEIPNKPLFGLNTPINPKYEKADTPEVMGAEKLGFGNELLKKNKKRFLKQIEKLAKEKGTWTPENLRKKEAYKTAIYNLPLIHFTTLDNFGKGKNFYDVLDNLESTGLQSHENLMKIKKVENTEDNDKKTAAEWSKTYNDDIEIGRDKYVYFCVGSIYMTRDGGGFIAIMLEGDKLKSLNCIIQEHSFQTKLNIYQAGTTNNQFQFLNETSLLGQDWVEVMSTAIATKVINFEDMNTEVMFRDSVKPKDINCVLFASDENNRDSQYRCMISYISKLGKINNYQKGKSIPHINIPTDFIYRMQKYSSLKFLKPNFTKPNTPWYQKVYENFLEESKLK